jgi:hypothetical protein
MRIGSDLNHRRASSVPEQAVNPGQRGASQAAPSPRSRHISPAQEHDLARRTCDSQAQSASSILVTRSMLEPQVSGLGLFIV